MFKGFRVSLVGIWQGGSCSGITVVLQGRGVDWEVSSSWLWISSAEGNQGPSQSAGCCLGPFFLPTTSPAHLPQTPSPCCLFPCKWTFLIGWRHHCPQTWSLQGSKHWPAHCHCLCPWGSLRMVAPAKPTIPWGCFRDSWGLMVDTTSQRPLDPWDCSWFLVKLQKPVFACCSSLNGS